MSTSTTAQHVLTVVKDKFAEVITEGTLSPTVKPSDWNVITEKALLDAMRMPSPQPEETWKELATLYNKTFPSLEEYWEFTVNRLVMWGNTLEYKLFDSLYANHQNNICTVKKLRKQAMALLEEANQINDCDLMIHQEIKSHVGTITRANLHQQIRKSQWVRVITSPTPLPGPSWRPDNSHQATYSRNYTRPQYQCFQCGILPILNGIVRSTLVECVIKWHLDTHPGHVEDTYTMMESTDIMILMVTMMETSPENAELHELFVYIYFSNHSNSQMISLFYHPFSSFPISWTNHLQMFLSPTSHFNPVIHPSSNKPYPPTILVKHHTWVLKDANLFICCDHVLYGLHQSHFNQSLLFQEIVLYGEINEIGVNPYHPIPFNTLTKEVFHNFFYLLYFGAEHLEHLTPEDWHQTSLHWLALSLNYCNYHSKACHHLKKINPTSISNDGKFLASIQGFWWTGTVKLLRFTRGYTEE
jgi:hypothetical protein